MSRTYHMHLDLRGMLRRAINVQQFEGLFRHATEPRPMTGEEAFNALFDQVKRGRERIPMIPCDSFDFEKGCPGHEPATLSDEPEHSAEASS